jgi:hypothetical protein
MKRVLFALCLFAMLSAMEITLDQQNPAFIEYRIEERGAADSTLTLVVAKDNVQHHVEEITGFDGLYTGQFPALGPGTYTVVVYDINTSEVGEASITIAPIAAPEEIEESLEGAKAEYGEEQAVFEDIEEQAPWLPYLIVVLFVLIVALLLFGNPLKKQKKRK